MIKQVRVEYFKQFKQQVCDLDRGVVLAGPNNSGKSTLMQAIVVWDLAFRKWSERHSPRATERYGIPVTRSEFTAVPLRDIKHLWTNASAHLKKADVDDGGAPGQPRRLFVELSGSFPAEAADGEDWALGFELKYQSSEQVYVRPSIQDAGMLERIRSATAIVHVPPFSGIGVNEPRHDRPYQDLLVGQGKAGDILRNLLLELYESRAESGWMQLCKDIDEIFGFELVPPKYDSTPYIVSEYRPGRRESARRTDLPVLDIASAGSGFHQVLLILAFLYARPATIVMLDEPDAHQHVILQQQIYDRLRGIAERRGSQLVVATHSEVLINNTPPERILSFFQQPHRLVERQQRDQLREALKRLSALDILLAEETDGILYVEDESDFNILKAWAGVLDHPLRDWFSDRPFWHPLRGNQQREAREHFFALRSVRDQLSGVVLLDGDASEDAGEYTEPKRGLLTARWSRYEIESYLIHPDALARFVERRALPLAVPAARAVLENELPKVVLDDPRGDHDYFKSVKVSEGILPRFLQAADLPLSKQDYHFIAAQMDPGEVSAEVSEKLDRINEVLRPD